MKNTAYKIGWICFIAATAVYLIATCCFGYGFLSTGADYRAGESVGYVALFLLFMIYGSIAYAVAAVISIIGAIVANVKRGERKFFFAPVIILVLSVLTWCVFFFLGTNP